MAPLDAVVDRIEALRRFVAAARNHLSEQDLAPAEAVIGRAGERLSLSRTHTVVALAGATGSGKSSLFNALAGLDLSPASLRRPTTGQTHACVWTGAGRPGDNPPGDDDAGALLDWLRVDRRFTRDDGGLDGLVLLDLPDFDSVESEHRVEVDRLLSVVDLIVWVLHPQKYADKVVHHAYLRQFHRHRDVTVVVLNAADLLGAEDLRACLADLRQLLIEDGLAGVPVMATSTKGPPGVQPLADALVQAVGARMAMLVRLGADLEVVADGLGPLVDGPAVDGPDKHATKTLVDALTRASGAPLVAAATERAYVHRARKIAGWPPARWLRRLRPDPLARLRVEAPAGATSIGPAAPAAQAAVGLALRDLADQTAKGLPAPWRDTVLKAARSTSDTLTDDLDVAVARTDLGLGRTRTWWRFVGILQWIATAAAVAGLLWLGVRYVMFALALPEIPMPEVGRLPLPTALLGGGLLATFLIALVARPAVRLAAKRQRRRAEARLRTGIAHVAQERVIAPVQSVIADYQQARTAWSAVRAKQSGQSSAYSTRSASRST
jgi:energy-coupling factor transporter ATP-binding protein EcfA2